MAAVMFRAAQVEDSTNNDVAEKVARLEYENKHLRQLLEFSIPREQLVVDLSSSHSSSAGRSQTTPFLNPGTDKDNDSLR